MDIYYKLYNKETGELVVITNCLANYEYDMYLYIVESCKGGDSSD